MPAPTRTRPPVIATLAAVPTDIEGGVTTWIQILKTGAFSDWRYGDFTVTTEDLEAMIANFRALERAIPGDFDHSFAEGLGSRAAGWTRDLEIREDGTQMWAEVEFTAAAADMIRAGEYRYISPEFSLNYLNERGEALGPYLMAWALTNRPFLEGMAEVSLAVARDGGAHVWCATATTKERSMVPKELRKRLGLAEDATDEQVLARAGELVQLAQPRTDAVVLTQTEVAELRQRADDGDKAREELRLARRTQVITDAIRDGRLAPAMQTVMERAFDADPDGTTKALAELPKSDAFRALGTSRDADGDDAASGAPAEGLAARIEERALALTKENPNLSYRDALYQADRELRPVGGVR